MSSNVVVQIYKHIYIYTYIKHMIYLLRSRSIFSMEDYTCCHTHCLAISSLLTEHVENWLFPCLRHLCSKSVIWIVAY